MSKRCGYLFQLRHYHSPEQALAGATMFAVWTMANGDYLGMTDTDRFIEVTAAYKQEYTNFIENLSAAIRTKGKIGPQTPPGLQVLIDQGLDIEALLKKHPPIPAAPFS